MYHTWQQLLFTFTGVRRASAPRGDEEVGSGVGAAPLPAFIFSPLSNVDIMINLPSNQYRLPQGYNQQDLESVSSFYE